MGSLKSKYFSYLRWNCTILWLSIAVEHRDILMLLFQGKKCWSLMISYVYNISVSLYWALITLYIYKNIHGFRKLCRFLCMTYIIRVFYLYCFIYTHAFLFTLSVWSQLYTIILQHSTTLIIEIYSLRIDMNCFHIKNISLHTFSTTCFFIFLTYWHIL